MSRLTIRFARGAGMRGGSRRRCRRRILSLRLAGFVARLLLCSWGIQCVGVCDSSVAPLFDMKQYSSVQAVWLKIPSSSFISSPRMINHHRVVLPESLVLYFLRSWILPATSGKICTIVAATAPDEQAFMVPHTFLTPRRCCLSIRLNLPRESRMRKYIPCSLSAQREGAG